MEKSFGMFFYLKKGKSDKGLERTVYVHLTTESDSVDNNAKRKCTREKWNQEAVRMSRKYEEALPFNAYLDTLQQKVFEAKRKLLELDNPVTPQNIKDLLLGKEIHIEKKMIMEIFRLHNEQMEKLVGNEFSPATLERYKTSYRHTQSFIQSRYKVTGSRVLSPSMPFFQAPFWSF